MTISWFFFVYTASLRPSHDVCSVYMAFHLLLSTDFDLEAFKTVIKYCCEPETEVKRTQ